MIFRPEPGRVTCTKGAAREPRAAGRCPHPHRRRRQGRTAAAFHRRRFPGRPRPADLRDARPVDQPAHRHGGGGRAGRRRRGGRGGAAGLRRGALAARAAENFDYFAEVITALHGDAYQVGGEFLNYTIHKPVGVAGLITPWNAPLMLSTWKIAPCLAAGNTCVLKPAEWSPLTATRLAALVAEVGLPPGVFNVVHGFGERAGAALVAHPGVNLISFTGETTTGSAIMANGAATLKRYSFELGGKSPVVVFDDCDPERALDGIVYQIFTLNGQRCTAGSRLLVQEPLYEGIGRAHV